MDDYALCDAKVIFDDTNTRLELSDGVTVDNALASSGANYVDLEENATWLELGDGVSVGGQSTLVIDNQGNAHGLSLYDGAVTVTADGTLGGTGRIGGAVTVAGGTVAPGASIESLISYFPRQWNGGLFTVDGSTVNDGDSFLAGGYWRVIDYDANTGGANFPTDQLAGDFVNITAKGWPATLFMMR